MRLERYHLKAYHDMPYTAYGSMSVPDFFGRSISTVAWTSTDFLRTWTAFSLGCVRATNVFARIFEGGHISQSLHYAGLAADHSCKILPGSFPFEEDGHVALSPSGYPDLHPGCIGPYVFVLQDALMTLGYCGGELDGFFGKETLSALIRFKEAHNLAAGNICDAMTWNTLCFLASGCGITPTTSKILPQHKFFCSYSDIK